MQTNRETVSRWLSPREAAGYLRLSHHTLERFRRKKVGPRFFRVGPGRRRVVYDIADLDAWVLRQGGAQ
jgi:hypothetical protein